MAYILDGMTLAMEGTPLALTEDDDFAIQVFALNTIGIVVCPLIDLDDGVHPPGMAPRRIREEDDWIMAVIVAFLRMRGQ